MLRKSISVVIFLLLLLSNFIPNVSSNETNRSIIIYVDDDGGADYTNIQDAINSVIDGDTIFVYNGIYYENIILNKSINLIGENKETTIINGNSVKDVITVSSENIIIKDFSIQNSGNSGRDAGIEIRSNHTTITNNIFYNNTVGIYAYCSNYNNFSENIFILNNDYGVFLHYSDNNKISRNNFTQNRWGLYLIYSNLNSILNNSIYNNSHNGIWISRISNNNTIYQNIIKSNDKFGLYIYRSNNNNISMNEISSNLIGVHIFWSYDNKILKNNFIKNTRDATFIESDNYWKNNYWNKERIFPKIIIEEPFLRIPSIDFDLNPANIPNEVHKLSKLKNLSKKYLFKRKQKEENDILPSYFNWRNINGTDYTTPVINQAPAPTCETCALCASLETLIQYEIGYPFDCDLSETHLYFNSGGTIVAGGVLLGDAAEYLIENGVPDEGCFPDPHRPYDYPFESIDGWEDRTVKIQEWGWVENNIEAIKNALIQNGPLIIHIIVRPGFSIYVGGIYNPWPGEIKGGHVVTIVGYDDSNQCWIVKNSWGNSWGENGYFRVSYDSFTSNYHFIRPFYGGTGILYIDGIYGNLNPDVPKIKIEKPKIFHNYFYGYELPTFFREINSIQKGAPRIIGNTDLKINASNTDRIDIFVDGIYQVSLNDSPYELTLEISKGLHTIEIFAYNIEGTISKGVIDVYIVKD